MKKKTFWLGMGLNGSCVCNELIKNNYKVTAIDGYDLLEKNFLKKNGKKKIFQN